MKTQGEIEAAVCEGIGRFQQEYMGRGPRSIHTHLIGDLLVVRLQGVLTAAEQQLVKTLQAEKGRGLLKQVRTQLMETARPALEAMVRDITGAEVVLDEGDVRVDPEVEGGVTFGPGIAANPEFDNFLERSDLLDILRRQGQHAANKITHLAGHSERDEAKLFPRKNRRG